MLAVTALAMVAVLTVAAIVIDLGYTRGGAGFDQSSADLAALAGGDALIDRNYVEACQDVVDYVNTNGRPSPQFDAAACSSFGSTTCSGGTTSQAIAQQSAGSYDLTIAFPVPDEEIADDTFGAGRIDGIACERMPRRRHLA